jgi:hypothetical protein
MSPHRRVTLVTLAVPLLLRRSVWIQKIARGSTKENPFSDRLIDHLRPLSLGCVGRRSRFSWWHGARTHARNQNLCGIKSRANEKDTGCIWNPYLESLISQPHILTQLSDTQYRMLKPTADLPSNDQTTPHPDHIKKMIGNQSRDLAPLPRHPLTRCFKMTNPTSAK